MVYVFSYATECSAGSLPVHSFAKLLIAPGTVPYHDRGRAFVSVATGITMAGNIIYRRNGETVRNETKKQDYGLK